MKKNNNTYKGRIALWIGIVLADLLIYFLLAIFSMSFEDNYNSNFTEYFKSEELSIIDKMIPVFLYLWIYLNIGFAVNIVYRLLKQILTLKNNKE
jgi:hypothetical protein